MRPAMKTRRSEDSSLNRFATAFDFTAKATELRNTVLGTVASHLVVTNKADLRTCTQDES